MRVFQPNSWSCAACVAAMATDTTLEDVIRSIGHDGSQIKEDSIHPQKRRGFSLQEILRYMISRDLYMGIFLTPEGQKIKKNTKILEVSVNIENPAMVTVPAFGSGHSHVIYWDGARILDPSPSGHDNPRLESLSVVEWWPIFKIV